jgi:hypothetical protein
MRIRRIGVVARREHAKHGVLHLDADFDQIGVADGVDPERSLDELSDLARQRAVERREKRFWSGRRQVGIGQELDDKTEPFGGDLAQKGGIAVLRIFFVEVDQRRNIARHRRGKPLRHQVPVPFQKHE